MMRLSDRERLLSLLASVYLTSCCTPAPSINGELVQPFIDVTSSNEIDCPAEPFKTSAELFKQHITVQQNWDFQIACSDLPDLQAKALYGDVNAAHKIANMYMYGLQVSDFDRASYWLNIAAENGSPDAMRLLAYLYNSSDKPQYKLRGQFWSMQYERYSAHKKN